jgi:hypothetical protein
VLQPLGGLQLPRSQHFKTRLRRLLNWRIRATDQRHQLSSRTSKAALRDLEDLLVLCRESVHDHAKPPQIRQ